MRRIEDRDEDEDRDEERARGRRGRLAPNIDRVQILQSIEDGSMEVDINEQMSCLQIMDESQESQITVAYTTDPVVHRAKNIIDKRSGTHQFTVPAVIDTQPPSQITFNGNEIVDAMLRYFGEIFKFANGDPDLLEVYHAGRAFINNRFPQLNGNMSGINSVLKAIFYKVKIALNADKKLRERRVKLESFLTESFQEFVNRERDEILQMDIVELQQMVKALTSLTT
jgi:hypothetical protein